jgi:hypothetical protein
VVGHQHITMHLQTKTLRQAGNEPAKVLVSVRTSKNHSLFYPAIEDMVPSSFNIQSSRPCHPSQLSPLVALTSRLHYCLLRRDPTPFTPYLLYSCHCLGRRSAERLTSLGWLFLERVSTKNAQSFKITTTSSMNLCGRTQIYEEQFKLYSEP